MPLVNSSYANKKTKTQQKHGKHHRTGIYIAKVELLTPGRFYPGSTTPPVESRLLLASSGHRSVPTPGVASHGGPCVVERHDGCSLCLSLLISLRRKWANLHGDAYLVGKTTSKCVAYGPNWLIEYELGAGTHCLQTQHHY